MLFYNSLTRQKEALVLSKTVNLYVCGPTVYDYLHVGNFRGAIFFNALRNFLEYRGHEVVFAYNYTDVDDKILERAKNTSQDPLALSQFFIKEFEADYANLKLRPHTHNPKVSEYIPQMISYIEVILSKNLGYIKNGSVYLRRHLLDEVGLLSGRNINDGLASEKNEIQDKEHPSDFVLWKNTKEGEPLSWSSPWGQGRPGWHLECSVMIHEIFKGQTLDFHGGGLDLVPHHENECYQCKAHGQESLAKVWIHNNMLTIDGQKMSKSLGNVITGRDFMRDHSAEVLKFMVLFHQYRAIIDFGKDGIKNYRTQLARIYQALKKAEGKGSFTHGFQDLFDKSMKSLEEDFNTPEVLSFIYEAINRFNKNEKEGANLLAFVNKIGSILSIFQEDPRPYLRYLDTQDLQSLTLTTEKIENLIIQRKTLRDNKDYAKADALRKELLEKGINLLDTKEGTSWEVIRS